MTQLVRFERAFFATKGGIENLSATSAASLLVTNNVEVGGDAKLTSFTLTDSTNVDWTFTVLPGGILQGNDS